MKDEYQLLSHPPSKLLFEHLKGGCTFLFHHLTTMKLDFNLFNPTLVKKCMLFSYIFHDVGKATTYFQTYLKDKKKSKYKTHAHISAVLAVFSWRSLTEFQENDFEHEMLAALIYVAIKRHHGDLLNLETMLSIDRDDLDMLHKQYQSLENNMNEVQSIIAALLEEFQIGTLATPIPMFENVPDEFLRLKKHFVRLRKRFRKELTGELLELEIFFIARLLYSAVLFGDKSEVILSDFQISALEKFPLLFTDVVNYKSQLSVSQDKDSSKDSIQEGNPKNELNVLRDSVFEESICSVSSIIEEAEIKETIKEAEIEGIKIEKEKNGKPRKRIFSLHVPTGGGKTLTSLAIALQLQKELPDHNKIIYALPFINLIEQNYDVYLKILESAGVENPDYRHILLHHCRSEFIYNEADEEEQLNYQQKTFLMETWNSPIVLTTFHQLIDALVVPVNNVSKRFIQLNRAVLILDEVQCLPIKYQLLIAALLKKAAEVLDLYIVLMTATMPYLFNKEEISALIHEPKDYFSRLNRTQLVYHPEPIQLLDVLSDACFFEDYLSNDLEDQSFLFVMNTIRSSIDLYNYFNEHYGNSHTVYYMSTNITPFERMERLDAIRKGLANDERIILVSTQVVEAGMDLDFPLAFRDFSPLDSIIQVAGRCNRNGYDEKHDVHLFHFMNSSNKPFYGFIYDPVLLSITKSILEQKSICAEKEFYELSTLYFERIQQEKSRGFRSYWEMLCHLEFEFFMDPEDGFRLFENQYPTVDVFVELNDTAEALMQRYVEEVYEEKDPIEKKKHYTALKKDFLQFVISIPKSWLSKIELEPIYEDSFYKIGLDDLDRFYDSRSGILLDAGDLQHDFL